MELFSPIRDFLRQADDRELYTYGGIMAGVLCVLFGLLIYFHYRNVSWYTNEFKKLDKLRTTTRSILQDAKLPKLQQQQVDAILAQDKNFRIVQAYQTILKEENLSDPKRVDLSVPTTGESISGKTEVIITSTLRGLSMKEVTDFLVHIAQIPQLYTKDITINKVPGQSTVDVDITVATLEPSTLE